MKAVYLLPAKVVFPQLPFQRQGGCGSWVGTLPGARAGEPQEDRTCGLVAPAPAVSLEPHVFVPPASTVFFFGAPSCQN